MFYDTDELDKRDNIEVMEEQEKKNFIALFMYSQFYLHY